jgi:hypothetical protein
MKLLLAGVTDPQARALRDATAELASDGGSSSADAALAADSCEKVAAGGAPPPPPAPRAPALCSANSAADRER